MTDYPIPVERLTTPQAKRLICPDCETERDATSKEIENCAAGRILCDCGGRLDWKYAEGDRCPGCGRLGWWNTPYETNACSRACHLQAEYAAELAAKKASERDTFTTTVEGAEAHARLHGLSPDP